MAAFNYTSLAKRAHKIMQRFGRVVPYRTYLRRTGMSDREVVALESDFSARERDGVLVQMDDVRFLIAVYDPSGALLSIVPDEQQDSLVLVDVDSAETVLRIVAKPKRIAPGGVNVFWQLHCRSR